VDTTPVVTTISGIGVDTTTVPTTMVVVVFIVRLKEKIFTFFNLEEYLDFLV
jgi:hypothetical protein